MSHTLNTNVRTKPQRAGALVRAPSFKLQAPSFKLDSRSSLGYHRINGKVQQRSRFVGPSHITNRRHAHLVRSSMRAARKYPGVRPIKDLCQAVALQGIGMKIRTGSGRFKLQASSFKRQASSALKRFLNKNPIN